MNISELIGRTPLLFLGKSDSGSVVLGKAEFLNPGGSIKDRVALSIIEKAEKDGVLTKDKIIVDSTSGNTGIAYAMIGASKGYNVLVVVPGNINPLKKRIIEYFGASIVFTDSSEGPEEAHLEAKRIVEADPGRYFFANQYENSANFQVHYEVTAREIIEQTNGNITHFVACHGTGGTIFGVGKRLKEFKRDIRVVCIQPTYELHGIEGLRYMPNLERNSFYVPDVVDEIIYVKTEDAYAMQKRLAKKLGLLVGTSAAAAVLVSSNIAESIKNGTVVTILPDRGERSF